MFSWVAVIWLFFFLVQVRRVDVDGIFFSGESSDFSQHATYVGNVSQVILEGPSKA